ncbi:MAG: single-stranded DNA-binding protein [Bacilli bacterium]|nr:single-stranded DNA-binding protein [Bacilli bacterium]
MNDINVTTLQGRLTADATIKQFDNGNQVLQFSIAVNTSFKKGEEWVDYPNFFSCKYYGKSLEKLNERLKKGKEVTLVGHLKQDRWEKDGQKNSAVVVEVEKLRVALDKSGSSSDTSSETSSDPSEFPEDIPF